MRFLVDENLSPRLCEYLTAASDWAEHAHDATSAGATDREIMTYATSQGAIIVTADTDFGTLLAWTNASKPSVIVVRELLSLPVDEQGRVLAANLEQVRDALTKGAIVVVTQTAIRVRPLPVR